MAASLGELLVSFKVDLSGLSSGINKAKQLIASVGNASEDAASQVTSASSEMADAVQQTATKFNQLAEASTKASTQGYQASTTVSELDIAQAKLTLLESKVNEARDKLQTLQNAADAGKAVTGLAEAQAQLTLLEGRAQAARASFQEMATGATNAAEEIAADTTQVTEKISSIATTAQESSGGFLSGIGSMIGKLTEFGSRVGMTVFGLQNLWQSFTSLAGAILAPNASMEQTKVAFVQLLGSSQAATKELQDLSAFAAATPFEFPDLATAVQKLLAFQIPLKSTKPLLTAIGDALSGLGKNTPATLQQVVDVFGQMNSAGRIQTQDLMQLTSVGINGFQILADQMHKPVNVIRDMVSRGLIPAKEGIDLLQKGMEKTFGGGMQAQSQTFNGLLSTFKDNIGAAWRAFTGPLFDAAKSGLVTLGNLVSSPVFQNFAQGAGKAIADVFGHIGSVLSPLKGAFSEFSAFLQVALEPLHDEAIGIALGAFQDLGATIASTVAPAFKKFGDMFSGGGMLAGFRDLAILIQQGLTSALYKLPSLIDPIGKLFQTVSQIVGGQLSADFKLFSGIAKDLGKWWQSTMAPAIAEAMPGFTKLASVIGGTVVPAFAKIWAVGQQVARQLLPPLTKVFETIAPIIVKVGGFLADNLGKALQFIAPFAVQAAQEIGKFAGEIIDRVTPIVQGLWEKIQGFLDWIKPYWPAIWDGIKTTLTSVWDIMKGAIQIAWAIISGVIKIGLDLLSGNWKKVWDDIKGIFSGVWDGIKSIASGVWNSISGVFKSGINTIIGMINNFIGFVDGIGVDIGPVHIHPHIPKIPLLASGGFLEAGQVGIVGESGPELAIGGPGGTSILSNGASRAALAGSQSVHVHVHLNEREITRQIGVSILDMVRVGGPVGRIA